MKSPSKSRFPQPLLTPGQLFQIRAAGAFERLKEANALAQRCERLMGLCVEMFYSNLPEGYQLLPYGGAFPGGEPQLYAIDGNGNDVMFPCSRVEGWEACWRHSGQPAPILAEDSRYNEARQMHAEVSEIAVSISKQIDQIQADTPGSAA